MSQPQDNEKTKMVADTKKIKVRMVRDAYIDRDYKTMGLADKEYEVTEEMAKELCDTQFDGLPRFRGERAEDDPDSRPKITRAVRL